MEKTSEANPEKISAGSPAEVHCQLACQYANIHSQKPQCDRIQNRSFEREKCLIIRIKINKYI